MALRRWLLGMLAALGASAVAAQETAPYVTAYAYDPHGRVVEVKRSATLLAGGLTTRSTATYAYDAADNRTGYVSELPDQGGGAMRAAPSGGSASAASEASDRVDGEGEPCPFAKIVTDDPSALVRAVCVATAEEAGLVTKGQAGDLPL